MASRQADAYSWLATLGCCAPQNDEEQNTEARARRSGQTTPIYAQPKPLLLAQITSESPRPFTSHSVSSNVSQWVSSSKAYVQRASSRASTLPGAFSSSNVPARRPTISKPTEFRHVNENESVHRRSFRPLELSIYSPKHRLSPLPDFTDWDQKPAGLEFPAQAVLHSRPTSVASTASSFNIARKPVRSSSLTTSTSSTRSSVRMSTTSNIDLTHPPTALQSLPENPNSPRSHLLSPLIHRRTSTHISLPVLHSTTTSSTPSSSTLTLTQRPTRPRSSTDPSPPPLRKRPSFLSTRHEIDAAIRELNTIIEERRADAFRCSAGTLSSAGLPPPSPSHHVPALAPSLRMRVRSETLEDIGSAFSTPLTAKPLPLTPGQKERGFGRAARAAGTRMGSTSASVSSTGTFSARRASPSPSSTSTPLRFAFKNPTSAVSLWLRRQTRKPRTSSSSTPAPFYNCAPPVHSACTPLDSVSTFTAASSPPSLSVRTSLSIASPVTPRDRSFSMRSGRSGLGKWKGEDLLLREWRGLGRKSSVASWVVEKEMRVDPLRMNPKTPVGMGVGVAY